MAEIDFSTPHPDTRIETFAHAIACGTKQKKAFEMAGLAGVMSATPYNLARRKDVLGRVKHMNPTFEFRPRRGRQDSYSRASGKRGTIYALINSAMPGMFKVGFTTGDVEERRKQLSNTSVPVDYEVYRSVEVDNAAQVEKLVHNRLDRYRTGKEFFQCAAASVDEVFDDLSNGIFFDAAEEIGAFARSIKAKYPDVKLTARAVKRVVDVTTGMHPLTGESMTFNIPISTAKNMIAACSKALDYADTVHTMVNGRL